MTPVTHTLLKIILLVIVLLVVFIIIFTIGFPALEGGFEPWKKRMQQKKIETYEKELTELCKQYDEDADLSNGCQVDTYEASVILATAIYYTWLDCHKGRCADGTDFFHQFFAEKPIILTEAVDCTQVPLSGFCDPSETGVDKRSVVDEWTVTVWGLRKHYPNFCEDFGNNNCGGFDVSSSGKGCGDVCGDGDVIRSWNDAMRTRSTYRNIKIEYKTDILGERIEVTV